MSPTAVAFFTLHCDGDEPRPVARVRNRIPKPARASYIDLQLPLVRRWSCDVSIGNISLLTTNSKQVFGFGYVSNVLTGKIGNPAVNEI